MFHRVLGACVKPSVERFVYAHALATSKAEILRGARRAAGAVSKVLRTALEEKSTKPLEAIQPLVDPKLHTALGETVQALSEVGVKSAYDVVGEPRLANVRMVVGPDRKRCAAADAPLSRLELGDSLVVVGGGDEFLYSLETQDRLLREHGATIRLEVAFDDGFANMPDFQTYLFETFIPGSRLAGTFEHSYDFTIVDINAVAQGNEFWRRASPAPQLSITEAARLFTSQ